MLQDDGVLKFDYEEIEDFVNELNELIGELEDDIAVAQKARDKLELVASSQAMNDYNEYGADIADYQKSINFYEAIVDDLQEFLDEVDNQAVFTRDTSFMYDGELMIEINEINTETLELKDNCSISIVNGDYTPFGAFERGNFLHQGSPEEELIDYNDGRMESWAEEINFYLSELTQSAEELDRLHKLYFEDITLNDWKASHDAHDGMADEAYDFFHNNFIGNTIRGFGKGANNLAKDVGNIIKVAVHPKCWGTVLNNFFQTLGYVAKPSNWFNIGLMLASTLALTIKEEGIGYALGNGLFFLGEEILTDGAATLKLADTSYDVAKMVSRTDKALDTSKGIERTDDALDASKTIKRVDKVENTAKTLEDGTIQVTAKDGTVYEYSGRMQNKRYAGKINPKTGIEYDINGFPIFNSKVTYELPKSQYELSRSNHDKELNKQLYTDIESGIIDNPFPTGVDYSSLEKGKMVQYYDAQFADYVNYFTWHHHQEPGILQLIEFKLHKATKHTGGFKIWGRDKKR